MVPKGVQRELKECSSKVGVNIFQKSISRCNKIIIIIIINK